MGLMGGGMVMLVVVVVCDGRNKVSLRIAAMAGSGKSNVIANPTNRGFEIRRPPRGGIQ
jgi:hypothetical protein